MKITSYILVLLVSLAVVSANEKALDSETEQLLQQLEHEALVKSDAALHKAQTHAGVVEEFTRDISNREAEQAGHTVSDVSEIEQEVSHLQDGIEKIAANKEEEQQKQVADEARFAEVKAGAEAEASSGEATKEVLKDLKKELTSAKGEEAKLIQTQIKAMEGKSDSKEEKKSEEKKSDSDAPVLPMKSNKNDNLKKLIAGLKSIQKGGTDYSNVHALILSTIQEVRIAWQQKQADAIHKIELQEQKLQEKKALLMKDSCESNECVPESPVPYVAPVTEFDCPQHAQTICQNSQIQCNQGCGSMVVFTNPTPCQSACVTAQTDCLRVQLGSCGSSFLATAENAQAPQIDVNDPTLVRPIEVPHQI